MSPSRFRLSERQVLHFIMLTCFIGFISAFVVVFLHKRGRHVEPTKHPIVRWLSPRVTADGQDVRYLIANLEDPSLMSLPSVHAFSKSFWQRRVEPDIHPLAPTSTLAYLDTAPPSGLPLLLPSTPLADSVRLAAGKPIAAVVDIPATEPLVPLDRSVFQFSGPLRAYPLLHPPALPTIASETPLRPTEIQFAVSTADGAVQYAVLRRSSGNETADTQALEALRRLRFILPSTINSNTLIWDVGRVLWSQKLP